MREIVLTDWGHFIQTVSELAGVSAFRTPFLFRGQVSRAWSLQPKIARALQLEINDAMANRIEKEALRKFRREAHLGTDLHSLPHNEDRIGWWSLMQRRANEVA